MDGTGLTYRYFRGTDRKGVTDNAWINEDNNVKNGAELSHSSLLNLHDLTISIWLCPTKITNLIFWLEAANLTDLNLVVFGLKKFYVKGASIPYDDPDNF